MEKTDQAFKIANVRLLSAIYFALLALMATIAIDVFLFALGVEQILAVFKSLLLSVVVASIFGALFGNKIVHCKKPYKSKAFWWGFLMVITALPIYNLGLVLLMHQEHNTTFTDVSFIQMYYFYFFSLAYLFILVGLWLAIIAGFAAIYLRGHLVYDILETQNMERKFTREQKTKMHKALNPHRTRISH